MTILNTTTQPSEILALWIALILGGGIGGLCCLGEYMTKTACVLFLATVIGILGCIFWLPLETQYECLFKEGTDYSEVAKQWNVVEQRGDIWVVTAKEGTDAADTLLR